MVDILEGVILEAKDTGNLGTSCVFYIPLPMKKGGFGTSIEEKASQYNEGNFYTRGLHLHFNPIVHTITSLSYEDIAPELGIEEASRIAQNIIRSLPDDMIDADLGPGL